MLSFIFNFNLVIFILFTVMYCYQIFYALVTLLYRKKDTKDREYKFHKYAVIIAARNESAVIGELIKSIKAQKYPESMLDVFVVADNCTDDTAEISKREGAFVFERKDEQLVGKGYALDFAFDNIKKYHSDANYEGYFIFDADNLMDENYVAEMNKVFDKGYKAVTSYRNSKNYGDNWISAGYALWFLREAKYLNNSRMLLNTSCAVSGTGFLVSSDIIRKNNGWKYHLLTEDIEFSIDSVIQGEKIGYCGSAMFYDEQPTTFKQSWDQRLRWSKGFYQVFGKYGGKLVASMFQKGKNFFSSYDMLMTVAPAMLVSLASVLVNGLFFLYALDNVAIDTRIMQATLSALLSSVGNFYLVFFAFGALTTITEWDKINTPNWKKILYIFTFPIYIFTYIPISIVALFKKVEWKPISHGVVKSINELQE